MLLAVYCYWEHPKRYLSVFLMFFLITAGFQLVPSSFLELSAIGVSKPHDWVLIYALIIMVLFPVVFLDVKVWKEVDGIQYLLFTLVFLTAYSAIYVGVETQVTIRVLRNYLFFILIFPFLQLSRVGFYRVLQLVVYFTSLASFLYCLQPLIGSAILSGAPVENALEAGAVSRGAGGILRFYNLPFLVVPTVFILFAGKSILNIKYHNALLLINLLAVVLSQHRNLLLTLICCSVFYLIIYRKINFGKVLSYGLMLSLLFIGVDIYFSNRFSEGVLELFSSSDQVTPYMLYSTNISEVSTTEFRRLHFFERFLYAQKDIWTSLFGLGFLTEDSVLVDRLSFTIGLTSEYGEVAQVDTSDIAWSVFVVHFGIVGTLALLYFYWSLTRLFLSKKDDVICKVGVLYLLSLIFTSFYSVSIILPQTFCLIVFLAAYCYKYKSCEEYGEREDWSSTEYAANDNFLRL